MYPHLDKYLEYSSYTDPCEYVYLYKNLPDKIYELNSIIKDQLIHPISDIHIFEDVIPMERRFEDRAYPDVRSMLAGLLAHNEKGLISSRPPQERLVLSCRNHSILLASILKHKNIPARVRFGFVPYLKPGLQILHIITEAWSYDQRCWLRIDPDRKIDDMHELDFITAAEVWQGYRTGTLDRDCNTYGVEDMWGFYAILSTLCHDFESLLGNEIPYWECCPACTDPEIEFKSIPVEQVQVLDRLAELLSFPDNNMKALIELHNSCKMLRFD
jgi:hypothetical protein